MTVVSRSSTITFSGDGVQDLFDFNFRVFREDDLSAVVRSNGESKELILGTDFKIISGIGNDSGGRVQYPVSGTPLSNGESITIFRNIPYSQELELVDNDPFSASLLNEAFDRGVMRDQQLQEQLDRALKYEISTPIEELLTPQVFMQRIVESRDNSVSALSGAEQARTEALGAQSAAEIARGEAVAAQTAAEAARDSAQLVAFSDLAALRSIAPVLSGDVEAFEGTTVSLSIVDHVEDGETSYDVDVSGFGTATVSGSTINWNLGTLSTDTLNSIRVVRRRRGEVYSETSLHQLLVKKVLVQDGPTVVFADSTAGWNKEPDAEGFQPPAYSVGAENYHQVVSAQMEITQVSGELTVAGDSGVGSVESPAKLVDPVEVNDVLIAATSAGTEETVVQSVVANGETDYSVAVQPVLTGIPTKVFKKSNVLFALGAGITGEYLGPEIPLTLDAENSTLSELKITSAESIRDKIFVTGGKHNNLKCDGVVVAVASVSEQITPGSPVNILPTMTAATTEGVTFTASAGETGYPDVNPAWYAGDGSAATRWQTDATLPQQLSVILAGRQTISGIALTCGTSGTDTSRMVKNFAIEGRLTDGSWTVLKNITDATGWNSGERREYLVDSPADCDELRVNVSANNGDSYLCIGDLEVLSAPNTYATTVNLVTSLTQVLGSVAITDRCTLSADILTFQIVNNELRLTADIIELEDDPDSKQLAMAVKGPADMRFKAGKIYIKEK